MEIFAKIQIPKGKRVVTKVVDNELLVYFTDSSNIEKPQCLVCSCLGCDVPHGSRCVEHMNNEHSNGCFWVLEYEKEDLLFYEMLKHKGAKHKRAKKTTR
jgi:hypothetical protein